MFSEVRQTVPLIPMDYLSVRKARDSLYRLIDDVAEHHKPVVMSGKRSNAVLVSREDWDAIQETLYE